MFVLALAAVAVAAPAKVDPAVAEITRLEERWGQAFVTRDFGFIERIVAPEYRLVVADPNGKYSITQRAEWMKNGQTFKSHAFAVETVDVNRVGDTAVASAQGVWTVSRKAGEAPRSTRFSSPTPGFAEEGIGRSFTAIRTGFPARHYRQWCRSLSPSKAVSATGRKLTRQEWVESGL